MNSRRLEQANSLYRLSNKLIAAAIAGDDQLFEELAAEGEHQTTEMVNQIEEERHPCDPETREEDQLLRESDERAAFNDHLDNLRNER